MDKELLREYLSREKEYGGGIELPEVIYVPGKGRVRRWFRKIGKRMGVRWIFNVGCERVNVAEAFRRVLFSDSRQIK